MFSVEQNRRRGLDLSAAAIQFMRENATRRVPVIAKISSENAVIAARTRPGATDFSPAGKACEFDVLAGTQFGGGIVGATNRTEIAARPNALKTRHAVTGFRTGVADPQTDEEGKRTVGAQMLSTKDCSRPELRSTASRVASPTSEKTGGVMGEGASWVPLFRLGRGIEGFGRGVIELISVQPRLCTSVTSVREIGDHHITFYPRFPPVLSDTIKAKGHPASQRLPVRRSVRQRPIAARPVRSHAIVPGGFDVTS